MPDEKKWAGYVRSHRLAQNMNQSEFANSMGVSQQTVSRWESGMQIPDISIRERLKDHLRTTALASSAFWKTRIATSQGHEILVNREMIVLAASRKASALLGTGAGPSLEGQSFQSLFPEPDLIHDHESSLNSIKQFRDIGFFDGLIRSIRLEMDWHLERGSCACKTDVWPVLTSEQHIIGQFSGTPVPIAKDPDGFKGIRVKQVTVRLNKDSQND